MAKDKMSNLVTYQQELKYKLTGPVPTKHTNHPETYKAFLKNELRIVESKLDYVSNHQ